MHFGLLRDFIKFQRIEFGSLEFSEIGGHPAPADMICKGSLF